MKNTSKWILTALTAGVLGCGLLSQHAQAVPIDGTINFAGPVTISNNGTVSNLTFRFPLQHTTAPNTGSYSSVPAGVATTFTSFGFNNTTLAIVNPHNTPFVVWTFTFGGKTYDFLLESPLDFGVVSTTGHPKTADILGHGIAQITGFDDTPGTFQLHGTGFTSRITFVASTTAVPDGGSTVALLGLALAGVEGVRRTLAARKAA